mgnify:CR=1 FL=1
MKLWQSGAYFVDGKLVESADGCNVCDGRKKTMAYSILQNHNTSGDDAKLKIKFDKITNVIKIWQIRRDMDYERKWNSKIIKHCWGR